MLSEIRVNIKAMVGWLPDEIPESLIESARRKSKEGFEMLQEKGDFSSNEARDLFKALHDLSNIAEKVEQDFETMKISEIANIKKRGGWT